MKKLLIIIPILFLSIGYVLVSENNRKFENSAVTSNDFVFEDESYTLTLPTDYELESGAEYGFINPKTVGNFPPIKLGLMASKENPSIEDILKDEKTMLANLCGQTEGCGKITKWESVEIGEKTALKFTVQYQGRGIDDPNGYINEYHYSVPHIKYEYDGSKYPQDQNKYPHTYVFQFSVSANDLENPEHQEATLDNIIKTISLR